MHIQAEPGIKQLRSMKRKILSRTVLEYIDPIAEEETEDSSSRVDLPRERTSKAKTINLWV